MKWIVVSTDVRQADAPMRGIHGVVYLPNQLFPSLICFQKVVLVAKDLRWVVLLTFQVEFVGIHFLLVDSTPE